jgi:hypothetical protein
MNKDISKCPLKWWGEHKSMFSNVEYLACQILSIVGSQIGIENIFFSAKILANLIKRCHLQMNNFKKLILVNKNWFNDPTIGYSSTSNLVELIEIKLN